MKIGVISDVHGNLNGLRKALGLFAAQGVEQILCAGDLVDRGPHGDEVVKIIREKQIPCVRGNHDAMAKYTQMFYDKHPELSFGGALSKETLAYLDQLPASLTFEWAGVPLVMTHANPWHDDATYIYPNQREALFRRVIDEAGSQTVILGHTHHPMVVQVDEGLVLNPGSVSGNRDRPVQSCAILTLPERTFDVYDIQSGRPLPLPVTRRNSS